MYSASLQRRGVLRLGLLSVWPQPLLNAAHRLALSRDVCSHSGLFPAPHPERVMQGTSLGTLPTKASAALPSTPLPLLFLAGSQERGGLSLTWGA